MIPIVKSAALSIQGWSSSQGNSCADDIANCWQVRPSARRLRSFSDLSSASLGDRASSCDGRIGQSWLVACGPPSLSISGWEVCEGRAWRPTLFNIEVALDGGKLKHVVQRRFRHFQALDSNVRPLMPGLPPLPSRGILRRRMNSDFLSERKQKLSLYLDALMQADLAASSLSLCQFLGLVPRVNEIQPSDDLPVQSMTLADLLGPDTECIRVRVQDACVAPCMLGIDGAIVESDDESTPTWQPPVS